MLSYPRRSFTRLLAASALGALAGLIGTLVVWIGSMYVLGRLTRHDLMTEIQRVKAAMTRG